MKKVYSATREELMSDWRIARGALPKEMRVVFYHYDEVIGYDGQAILVYRVGDTLYEVNGNHCSCFGLEGQWKPEVANLDELIHRAEGNASPKESPHWYADDETRKGWVEGWKVLLRRLKRLKSLKQGAQR